LFVYKKLQEKRKDTKLLNKNRTCIKKENPWKKVRKKNKKYKNIK